MSATPADASTRTLLGIRKGVTTPTEEKAGLKQEIIANAQRKILLADSSKYGAHSLFNPRELVEFVASQFGVFGPLPFGVLLGGKGGPVAAQYLLAGYGVFGVMGAAMFGFGVSVAMERTQGLLRLRKAMPMPPSTYLIAKLASAMLFSLTIIIRSPGRIPKARSDAATCATLSASCR